MHRAVFSSRFVSSFALATVLSCGVTHAAFVAPTDWVRPTTPIQASFDKTTYQEWQRFTSTSGPNAPSDGTSSDTGSGNNLANDGLFYVNPNDQVVVSIDDANAYDRASSTSNAFVTGGGNIYSPGGVIQPRVVLAGFDQPDALVHFMVQVRTLGSLIDTDFLSVNGVPWTDLPGSHAYQQLYSLPLGGFGGALVDHLWTFSAPDAPSFQIDFGWGVTSVSLDVIAVDTYSVVPEPASLAIVGLLVPMLLRRHRR